jgi:transcriptional regulator with XRE-family HTH domain
VPRYDLELTRRLDSLGRRIREERLKLDLSQEELADHAGLHRDVCGSVERGERNIGVGNLYTIAEHLAPSQRISFVARKVAAATVSPRGDIAPPPRSASTNAECSSHP